MINWVIKAFEENKNLLAITRNVFYTYLLMNTRIPAARKTVCGIAHQLLGKPNVFVVGDDDQSIYRFQGANVENMLGLCQQYKDDLLKVVLVNNYRSTQPILDVSKTLIDRNKERLVKKIEGLK